MNQKGIVKLGIIFLFVLGTFAILFTLFSSDLSSAIINKETYYLGEKVSIDLKGIDNYRIKINTPSTSYLKEGSDDVFAFNPEETGKYTLVLFYEDNLESYQFEVIDQQILNNEVVQTSIYQNEETFVKIGEPVRWKKEVSVQERIGIPSEAYNITLSSENEEIDFTIDDGGIASLLRIVGLNIQTEKYIQPINFRGNSELTYYTPGPEKEETLINNKEKKVKIKSSGLKYNNVLAFSDVDGLDPNSIKVYWQEKDKYIDFNPVDTNNDGSIDRIEWIIPEMDSDQNFIIILITSAQHLDENKEFISDIYQQVRSLDGIWSEQINNREYARVVFEKSLTSVNDITFYARNPSGKPVNVEVYIAGTDIKVIDFPLITAEAYYRELLTGMAGMHDSFDLKVVDQSGTGESYLEFDLIVDPTAAPSGATDLRAQVCSAESQGSQGSFGSACDGSYPGACGSSGDLLSCNDGFLEAHNIHGNSRYGGIRIESYNSSITNCNTIQTVELCYEWWTGTSSVTDCDISVDNDGDNSWQAVSSSCPGTSPNPGVSCVDVTSLEDWTCSNFFGASGTRARAKSEAVKTTNAGGPSTANWDVLYFDVDYEESFTGNFGVTLNSPENDGFVSSPVSFNYTPVSNDPIVSCSLWDDSTGSFVLNQTDNSITNGSENFFTNSYSSSGTFIWNVECCTDDECVFAVSNRTFTVDLTPPIVSLVSPVNGSTINDPFDLEFIYNATDAASGISSCSLYVDGIFSTTVNSVEESINQSFFYYLPNGEHSWAVECSDDGGNTFITDNKTVDVDITPSVFGTRLFETSTQSFTGNDPAIINLDDSEDGSGNTAAFSIIAGQFAHMVNATSHHLGNNGAIIPAGTTVNWQSSFTTTSGNIELTWKLLLMNSTSTSLLCQFGDDGPNGEPANLGTETASNSTCFPTDFYLSSQDRIQLVINGFNTHSTQARSITHGWEGFTSSFVDINITTEGFVNSNLTNPLVDPGAAVGESFNVTCEASCTIGICRNVEVYVQSNTSSEDWRNISSSGNIILGAGETNPHDLGNIGTTPVQTTFNLQGNQDSVNNLRCFTASDYDSDESDSTTINLAGIPSIYFTPPTLTNGTMRLINNIPINITIEDSSLERFIFNFNGKNYTFGPNELGLFYGNESTNDLIDITQPILGSGPLNLIPEPNLVLAYNFDNESDFGDANTVSDLSQYTNNGTINGATLISAGKQDGGISFSGGTDRVTVPSFDKLNGQSKATISTWVNQSSLSQDQYLLWADGNVLIEFGDSFNIPGSSNLRLRWNLEGDWRNSHTVQNILTTDEWNHWVFVFDNGATRIYLNGENIYNGTDTQTSISAISPDYEIGSRDSGGLEGNVDEFRIWDRALSDDEISAHSSYEFQKDSGTWQFFANVTNLADGVYSYYGYAENFAGNSNMTEVRYVIINTTETLPPVITVISPLEDLYGVSQVPFEVSVDKASNSCSYSLDGESNVSMTMANSTYFSALPTVADGTHTVIFSCTSTFGLTGTSEEVEFSVDATAPAMSFVSPTPADETTVTANHTEINISMTEANLADFIWQWNNTNYTLYNESLVLMMDLDNRTILGENSTNIIDSSIYGNNGVLNGNANWVQNGRYNSAVGFDGTNDWIEIPDDASLDDMDQFTFEAWILDTANDELARGIASKRVDSTNNRAWSIFLFTDREIYFDIGTERDSSGVAVTANEWTHLAVTFDGSLPSGERKKFYYNGELVGTADSTATTISRESVADMYIGILNANYGESWQGMIDEVNIYDRALSPEEVSMSYSTSVSKYDPDSWQFYANLTGLPDGEYNYSAYATDLLGKSSSISRSLSIRTDLNAPTITLISPANNSLSNSSTVAFNFTAVDNFDSSFVCNLYAGNQQDLGFTVTNNSIVSRVVNGLFDGMQMWNASCVNSADATGFSENWFVNVSESPSIQLMTANNSFFNEPNITLEYQPIDNTAFNMCELYVDGTSSQTNQSAIVNGGVNAFNISGISSGVHLWRVDCTDIIGLLNQSETRTFTVDTDGLNISLLYPFDGDELFTDTVEFSYNATDNLDNLLQCNINVNSQIVDSFNATNGAITNRSVFFTQGGLKYWNVTCVDDAFNSITSETRNFTLAFAPVVELINPQNNHFFSTPNITLFYNTTDDNDNIANSTLILNGLANVTNQSAVINGGMNNFTFQLPDGLYNWSVDVTDLTGLVGSSNETRNFTVDTHAPYFEILGPANNSLLDWNNITFELTAFDNIDQSLTCDIVINGFSAIDDAELSNGTLTNLTSIQQDGSYTWSIGCFDDAGNFNSSDEYSFVMEAPPRVTNLFPADTTTLNITDLTFVYLPEDAIGIFNCSLFMDDSFINSDDSVDANQNNTFDVNGISEGHHDWNVECVDAFPDFNTGESNTTNFTIDVTPPTVNLTLPLNGSNVLRLVDFNFTVSDNLDNELSCNLYVDGVLNATNINVASGSSSVQTLGKYQLGQHNWDVDCFDNAPNMGSSVTWVFNVTLADLMVNSSSITFNSTSPKENETVRVDAAIYNLVNVTVRNITVRFFDGDPLLGGEQIDSDLVIDQLDPLSSDIVSIDWPATLGTSDIHVHVDPPILSNGSIEEWNELNNNISSAATVGAWQYVYGQIEEQSIFRLTDQDDQKLLIWNASNFEDGNLFVADSESAISWTNLQAIGKTSSEGDAANDLSDLDTLLGMGSFVDSVSNTFTGNPDLDLIIFGNTIDEIPAANSTNNTEFFTGILWDTADDIGDGQFSQDDKEDLVFVTDISKDVQGTYGIYDYEIRIPARLREYIDNGDRKVIFYAEIR